MLDYEKAMSEFEGAKRPCGDVYGGDCKEFVGPRRKNSRDWKHAVRSDRRGSNDPDWHPTVDQMRFAAMNEATPPDCLRMLGNCDEETYGDVSRLARSNPSYPG
jgi:hypothetical protein